MQEMDVDEDVYDFLPAIVKNNMIYHCRVYVGADKFSDFVVTGGNHPVLYEIVGKQIVSSLQLNGTIFRGVALPTVMPSNDTDNISMKVYFSYKKKVKEPFYFLQIHQNLIIIGKIDQQLTVYREFKQIAEYRISDERCLGEPNVEIIYADDDGGGAAATSAFAAGLTESFELISLSYLNKGIDLRSLSGCCSEFDKITRNLRERVSKVSSELHETNVHIQKELHEYMTQCQTIDQHSNDNIHILSRYGDFWLRNINNHILIGIPIINCSTRKNAVEKIRISLNCQQRSQLIYTHKLYTFQTENAAIEPVNIQEICEQAGAGLQNAYDAVAEAATATEDDKNQNELIFNHEWTHQKQFVLYPDNTAIIVIKMGLIDFEINSNGCEFDVFAMYDVFLENGSWKELQTHLATIKIDSDILHDKRFTVQFDTNKLYQDLLAVIASTARQFFRLKFQDEVNIFQLHDLLLNRLSFESISTTVYVEDNFRFFLSQNLDLTDSMNHNEEDHRMYYCQQEHGYWSGTLIRIRTITDDKRTNDDEESYEMKIYNRDPIKIKNLCKAFITELGRKISIEPLTCYNRSALELELKYRFREEANALNELSTQLKYKTDKVQKSYDKFFEAQYKTDSVWAELINDQVE